MNENPKATDLPIEAKAVAAAWFWMMRHGDRESYLRFGMVESRPSASAQAGLDALVSAGYISQETDRGSIIYRPLRDMRGIAAPVAAAFLTGAHIPGSKFQLTEPISDRAALTAAPPSPAG